MCSYLSKLNTICINLALSIIFALLTVSCKHDNNENKDSDSTKSNGTGINLTSEMNADWEEIGSANGKLFEQLDALDPIMDQSVSNGNQLLSHELVLIQSYGLNATNLILAGSGYIKIERECDQLALASIHENVKALTYISSSLLESTQAQLKVSPISGSGDLQNKLANIRDSLIVNIEKAKVLLKKYSEN